MSGLKLKRLDMIIEPGPGNPQEADGVLDQAAARGPDDHLYLFCGCSPKETTVHQHRKSSLQ